MTWAASDFPAASSSVPVGNKFDRSHL